MVVVRMRTASRSSIRPSLTSPAHAWMTAMHVVADGQAGISAPSAGRAAITVSAVTRLRSGVT